LRLAGSALLRQRDQSTFDWTTRYKYLAFSFGDDELRDAAFQTNIYLGEDPHYRSVQAFYSAEVKSNFGAKGFLLI